MSGNVSYLRRDIRSRNEVWDTSLLDWVVMTQPVIKTDEITVAGVATSAKQDTTNNHLAAINSFTPSAYDTILLTYTGENLTGVVFKLGAATVSTLTLSYTGSQLNSVVKS